MVPEDELKKLVKNGTFLMAFLGENFSKRCGIFREVEKKKLVPPLHLNSLKGKCRKFWPSDSGQSNGKTVKAFLTLFKCPTLGQWGLQHG
jgi:hypothetical protein